MRALVCALLAALGLAAHPALAQADRTAATFWKTVQATWPRPRSRRASLAGHCPDRDRRVHPLRWPSIDADGELFRFGLTEAEHEADDSGGAQASLDHLGWWQVMKYWRSLYGSDTPDKLEVRATAMPRPPRRRRRSRPAAELGRPAPASRR